MSRSERTQPTNGKGNLPALKTDPGWPDCRTGANRTTPTRPAKGMASAAICTGAQMTAERGLAHVEETDLIVIRVADIRAIENVLDARTRLTVIGGAKLNSLRVQLAHAFG
jgi:hypothetical protein